VRAVGGEARNSLAVVETTIEDHQSVIYRNGAADFEMTEADVEAVDYAVLFGLITTGTVLAAEPSRSAAFRAFDLARAAGLPLIFDIDYRPYSWPSAEVAAEVYSRAGALCDVIVGNDVEFGFMAGDYDRGLDKARELVAKARDRRLQDGREGRDHDHARGRDRAPASTQPGAQAHRGGRQLHGRLRERACRGLPLREAVLQGSAAAAMVVARVGCAPAMPTRRNSTPSCATTRPPTAA
jgi:5-dehydro-2-deoxygluconokinase